MSGQQFTLKLRHTTPCGECPFRKKHLPGWLGGVELEWFATAIRTDTPIACHQTVGDKMGNKFPNKRHALCAGSAIHLVNQCKVPRDPAFAAELDKVQPSEDVFRFPQEFVDHHTQDLSEWVKRNVKGKA